MNRYIVLIFLIAAFSCNNTVNDNPPINYRPSDTHKTYKLLKSKMNTAYNEDDYRKALYFLQQLVQLDSTNGEYYYKIGYCESGLLNSQESTDAYGKAIKYNYRVVDATFNIGTNYLTVNDSLARIYFERCLAIDSNYESAKIQLMFIAQRNKKNEDFKARLSVEYLKLSNAALLSLQLSISKKFIVFDTAYSCHLKNNNSGYLLVY